MLARHFRAALKSTARLALGGAAAVLTAGAAFAGSGSFTSGASLSVNGTCTASTPYTQVAVTLSLTGTTNDGFGTDDFSILILDDQNTVVGTGLASANVGQTVTVTRNSIVRTAPNAAPYVMVLEDQGTFGTQLNQTYVPGAVGPELDRFTFDLNALDPDCPGLPDTTPPAVQSISLAGSPAANAFGVDYVVSFDEIANSVSTDDFSVTTVSGTATGLVASVSSSSGSTITVTVGSITGTGSIRLDLNGSTNIVDSSGNGNGTNGSVAAFTTGQVHTVDTVAPPVPTVDLAAASDSGVSDSDDITNVTSPVIEGIAEAGATVELTSSVDGVLGTATANGSGVWSLTPTLSAAVHDLTATATDGAGNTSAASSALSVTVDTTGPSSIFSSVPAATQTSAFSGMSASFSETVFGFTLGSVTTSSNVSLSNLTASATNDNFGFDVTPTATGTFTATFDIAAGAVTDAAGNGNTAASQQSVAFNVTAPDTTPPAVQSINVVGTPPASATSVDFEVVFDEVAVNVTPPDFSLTTTGTASGLVTLTSGVGTTFTVGITNISGDGTLRVDLNAGTDIADGVGNTPPAAFTTGQVHTVDTVAPAVPTVDLASASDSGVSDSDDITNVTSPVIEGITEAGATVELTSSVDGVLGTATANGSGVWSLTPTLSAAVHDLTATATDAAGNTSASSSALSVTIDTTGPASTFASVPSSTQTGAFSGMSASFNETVFGFTLGSMTTSSNVSLSNLTASSTNDNFGFDVTPTATGAFTATFDIAAGAVTDAAGNANTAASQRSVAFNVTTPDTTPPAVQSVTLFGAPAANAPSVSYTVTFDEPALNVTSDDFSLTTTGTASGSILNVSGSGASYTVTVSLVAGDGTLRLDLNAGTDIADGVGNTPPAAFTSGQVHTVDTVAPAVPTVDLSAAFDTGISNSDDITSNSTPFLTGVTDPNAFVSVTSSIDGSLGVATASASGVWALVPSSPLSDGAHAITAFAADGVGNNSATSAALALTIDTAGPTAAFASVPTTTQTGAFTGMSADFSEEVFGFALTSVTTSANVTLSNLAAASSNDSFAFDVAPSATGSFTATFDLAAGVVTDAAGNANTAAAQESVAFNVAALDTTPPAVASVVVLGSPAANAQVVDFEMTFDEPVSNVTADDFVVFSTNSSYVAGAPLTVTGSGTTYIIQVTIAGGSGLMRVNIDTQSDIVDASGNGNGNNGFAAVATFPISQAHTFDLDAPAAPVVGLLAATDTGVSNIDDITNDNTPIIAGVAEGGSTVEVSSSIAGVLGTATASGTGRWELQVPVVLADGVHVMTGTARDAAGNVSPVSAGLPVTIDTAAPSAAFASVPTATQTGAFTGMSAEFSEDVFGFALTSVTTSANVTLSNLVAASSNDSFTFDVTPAASGVFTATFDLAAGVVTDAAGNANTAAAQESVAFSTDAIPPSVALSGPSGSVSGPFQVTATFSEPVNGVTLADFSVTNASAAAFTAVSATVYTVEVTPAGDGAVTVDMAAGAATDPAGNLSLAAQQFSVTADVTPPSVVLSTTAGSSVSGPFQVDIVFSEAVTGFVANDVVVANGSVTGLSTNDAITFVADITPAAAGSVDVSVPAGVASDLVGNANLASQVLTQSVDLTPPSLTITLPANHVTGPFSADFIFSEPVTDFTLADISVANGSASALTGSGASYSATITPATLGDVTVAVAAGAARDGAGNLSLADSQDVSAVSTANAVTLTVASTVVNPSTVLGTATVTNPGSDALTFNASADVPWLTVDPASGSIPGLSSLALTIRANNGVDALDPGTYQGVVTVAFGSGSASPAAGPSAVSTGTTLAIPVTIVIEERFGSATLVVRTPGGPAGDATFTFASDVTAFDGVSLTTTGGQASVTADDLLFGVYAVSQAAPAGWVLETISCAGDTDGGSVISVATGSLTLDVDPGEAITCTFENRRDEALVVLATQQTIRNFMIRRADRLIEAAPELSRRFEDRRSASLGAMSANVDGSGRYQMEINGSISGLRNASQAAAAAAPGRNPERPFAENWDIWLAAEIGGVQDSRAGAETESDFGVVQLGVDYSVGPDLLVGVLGQYDWADETSGDTHVAAGGVAPARIEGEGWMAGPYAVWRLHDQLILDGIALYGRSDNQVNPLGLYEDSFTTDRVLLRATLTGELRSGPWSLRPQIGWTHFEETQDGYRDTLGFDIPSQTIAIGRLRAGPELVWRSTGDRGSYIELSSALRAVWDYQDADLLTASGLLAGADSLRADSRFGLTSRLSNGALVRLESAFAGLGQGEFEASSLRLEIRVPFGAPGRTSGGSLAAGRSSLCDNPAGHGFENAAGLAYGEGACATAAAGGAP